MLISKLKEVDLFDNLQIRISHWLLRSINGQDISVSLSSYIKNVISSVFSLSNEFLLDRFIKSQNDPSFNKKDIYEKKPINIFRYKYSENELIDIQVGTIHSAKGETHTATLYLETIYHEKHESERLIDFFKGNYNLELSKRPRHVESLKMAYVGMTRPSHFLCLALQKNRIVAHEDELVKSGWRIEKI